MKKFNIYKNTVEISCKERYDIKPGCTFGNNVEAELVAQYDTLEEAREDIKDRKSFIREFTGGTGRIMYEVEEYAIEEVKCDEEGNIDMMGDIWDYSKMEIKVVNEITKEIFKVFDNMKDAEQE